MVPVSNGKDCECDKLTTSLGKKQTEKSQEEQTPGTPVTALKAEGYTPRRLFFQKNFYVVWLLVFFGGFVNTATVACYKELGLSYLPDDIYLATVGTVSALISALSRPFWGALVDWFSLKTAFIIHAGCTCLLTTFWTMALHGGRTLYLLWTEILMILLLRENETYAILQLQN
nr:hypothetical protein BaRGS_027579 [Batillaria attramentaria]